MNARLKTILCTLVVVLFSFLPALADHAYYDFMENGIYYNIIRGTNEAYVNGLNYRKLPEHLEIPASVTNFQGDTYIVTQVGYYGFTATDGMAGGSGGHNFVNDVTTSVTLPETITSIEFSGLEKITEITFPESVVKLTGRFGGCKDLKEVTLPSGLNDVCYGLFANCESLEKVRLPKSLKHIGPYAFKGCTSLETIEIPDSVNAIERNAFEGCSKLKNVNFSGNSQLEIIGSSAFNDCKALEQFDFPGSLKEISNAFSNSGLRSIVVPESVVDNYMNFEKCSELRSATILANVTELRRTFADCRKLTEVKLPESITQLEEAFKGCTELHEVKLGDNVTTIGPETFKNSGIRNLIIPPSVNKVAYSAFENCPDLVSLTIEDSPEKLEFEQLSLSEEYYYPRPVLNSPVLWYFYLGRSMTNVSITGCDNTLTYVRFGPEVKEIGDSLLVNMTQITKLSIPNNVETIGASAFKGCEGLTSLYLGSSLREIGDHAFDGARNLTKIMSANPTPPDIYSETFLRVNKYDCEIYVPEGSAERYSHTDYWDVFHNFKERVFQPTDGISDTVSDSIAVRIEGGRLVLTGGDTRVTVYTADGRLVSDRQLAEGESLTLPGRGLYIVTAAGRSFKICY